ncbi:hypothetical protein GCM10007874_12320 [Labrys miyagiensis]|uniref:DUF2147 domain-containing protein n=1 Tax=Labrys miyagiensis TaxID=346912 RepID=A0ABQ6CJ09_9HYPH|nr:DUF2147 domain-containing protein [Labrys miyagiensis]GLS18216.1 hypothetical protein GCM10007874_12320 [Labrys miyagiensis]
MRRLALFLIALSVLVWPVLARAGGGFGDALGNWSRDDGDAKVRLAPCGAALCATNTWIRDPASSEKVGDRLEMKLQSSGADVWKGTAYDPQRQRSYAMTMSLKGGKLLTRGCVLGGWLCKSVSWTRIR